MSCVTSPDDELAVTGVGRRAKKRRLRIESFPVTASPSSPSYYRAITRPRPIRWIVQSNPSRNTRPQRNTPSRAGVPNEGTARRRFLREVERNNSRSNRLRSLLLGKRSFSIFVFENIRREIDRSITRSYQFRLFLLENGLFPFFDLSDFHFRKN